MKPILINLNEMTDSREVYESKPNIVLTIFIYTILALFITALLWMNFGRIDVVVKSEGMLRPNEQVATVINTYSGALEQVKVKDGSKVKAGDTLYIIEHEDLVSELDYYQDQLEDTEDILNLLNRYKQSVEDDKNYFIKTDQEDYYLKYQAYHYNYEQMQSDLEYTEKERLMNLNSVKEQLSALRTKLTNYEKLKKAVGTTKNPYSNTGSGMEYYNLFQKYQSDYQSIVTQYKNQKNEIDSSTTQEGLVNSLDYYENMLEGQRLLKESITNSMSVFEETNSYSLQYEEYVNKITDLNNAYEQAKENYDINKELEDLAVTEWEVQQSKTAMEEAKRALGTYQANYLANLSSNIIEVENKLNELNITKEHTVSKKELYQQNVSDEAAALDNFELKYLVELDNTIKSLKENITSLSNQQDSLKLQGEKLLIDKDSDTQVKLEQYRNNEIQTTISNIKTNSDKKEELLVNIGKLNSQIADTVVKASISGVVNSNVELVMGDILSSGTEVLSIIPDHNSEYKVNIYVGNKDIGKLKKDMNVKFNVYALPQTEYGYLTGTVTNISKDFKVDSSSGSGYYLVEAKVDQTTVYDSQGKKGTLKAGMTCQAQMITEKKRILIYLLEKLDLWINS